MALDLPENEQNQDVSQSLSIFLITLGIGILIFFISQIGQLFGAIVYSANTLKLSLQESLENFAVDEHLFFNGDLNAIATIFGGAIGILACYWAAKISKLKMDRVFPFSVPPLKEWLIWILAYGVVMIFMQVIESQTDLLEEEFMEMILSSITNLPLFILGVGILIPIFEELLVRGILYKGFKDAVNAHFAVLASSILFVFAHLAQYSFWVCLILLPLALVLGYSRHYTKSMLIPITIHILNNSLTAIFGVA